MKNLSYLLLLFLCWLTQASHAQSPQSQLAAQLSSLENHIAWEAVDAGWEGVRDAWTSDLQNLNASKPYVANAVIARSLKSLVAHTQPQAFAAKGTTQQQQWQSDCELHRQSAHELAKILSAYASALKAEALVPEWSANKSAWFSQCSQLSIPQAVYQDAMYLDLSELMKQSESKFEQMKHKEMPKQPNYWLTDFQLYGTTNNLIKVEKNSAGKPLYTEYWATLNKADGLEEAKQKMEYELDRCNSSFFQKTLVRETQANPFAGFTDNPEELAELKEMAAVVKWVNAAQKVEADIRTINTLSDTGEVKVMAVFVIRSYY